MKHQIHTLFLVALAIVLPTETAFAMSERKGNPHQIAWQPQKPIKFFPLAHTNQDDDGDQRNLPGLAPELSLSSGIQFLNPDRKESLIELMIRISIPQDTETPIRSNELTPSSIRDFALGIFSIGSLEEVKNSKSVINKTANSQGPEVPAPGVLGLLAIGAITAGSRRRTR